MKFCEDIIKEKTITEFDDGSEPKEDIKEINRKKRYFKVSIIEGEPYTEQIAYMIYTKVKKYKREDETDETGTIIIKEGSRVQVDERIIEQREERHIIHTRTEESLEHEEVFSQRVIERNIENRGATISRNIGLFITGTGTFLCRINPIVGVLVLGAGSITTGVSWNFQTKKISVGQRKRDIIIRRYLITYNTFNDNTEEMLSKNFLNQDKSEGDWEDINAND